MKNYNLNRISFPEIREIVKNFIGKKMSAPFIREGIGIFYANVTTVENIIKPGAPYIIEESRLIMVKRGSANITINMMDHLIRTNTIVFVGAGCIVQPHSFSPDIELCGIMLSNERQGMATNGNDGPTTLIGQGKYMVVEASHEEMDIADSMLSVLWKMVHMQKMPNEAINGMLRSFLHFYEYAGNKRSNIASEKNRQGRHIFEQFVQLVNVHCKQQHALTFYANQLCITPRYLGVVVKEASGISAKEWIDRAVTTSAQVLLRHSSKQVVEISEEMNFPNPSFFCKFFKRITGESPQQYRWRQ